MLNIVPATVISQDPERYRLYVSTSYIYGGQAPALGVEVLTHGPRDAVRGSFPELPLPGQLGLVAFPNGDVRNGVWLGSLSPAANDASTAAPGNPNTAYNARFSGGWDWEGMDGTTAKVWPDGSSVLVGATMPAPTRHVVAADQTRQAVPYTAPERVRLTPTPFPFTYEHPSGTTITVSAAGAVVVSGASGQPVTVESGGASVVTDGAGNLTLTWSTGESITRVATGTLRLTGNLEVTGDITAGYGGGSSVGLRTHIHDQPVDSHGDTEQPTDAPTPGT